MTSSACPLTCPLQLVTELPDSTKGGAKGFVMVRGAWAGSKHPARPFSPNYSLVIPDNPEMRATSWTGWKGRLFACLNKLFEIDAKERHYKTLLSARNLMAVVRESKEADAEKRRALLDDREKRKNEGTLRKAPGQKRGAASPSNKVLAKKRKLVKNGKGVKEPTPPKIFALPPITHEAEVIIEEPVNPAPHSISSRPGHVAGLNHSSTSLAVVARLANLAEEAASINHPGSPNPGVDAAEAGSSSKRPRSARNLRSGLIGRLQDRQLEIEVSCSSAYDAHPDGGEVEMATETSAVRYAELEDKLKQIPPGLTTVMPSAKMFEMVESVYSGEWSPRHGPTKRFFTDLLRTTDYMRAFATRRKDSEDQLHLRLEEAKASLSTVRENEALRADLAKAKAGRNQRSPACMKRRMRWSGCGGR
ncbi:hypothetical protein CK203_079647 [Vitis vinifera]|uniref:Uncharacterized protein n=1 Tax=Vitis vinifera TaxID=29760 RepID=A0A438DKV4_VITVI|nr:hypothetical protein CK203_079647 [Vitis vinifera]